MRVLLLVLPLMSGVVAVAGGAFAQAGTGGTQDGPAASGMVYPIRPRDEPAVSQPVPNVYRSYPPQQHIPRLRRIYPTHPKSNSAEVVQLFGKLRSEFLVGGVGGGTSPFFDMQAWK